MNIIFIAAPAAGKGTYSQLLEEKYSYKHISTGDMLREAIKSDTLDSNVKKIIEEGGLVSDDVIEDLIRKTLSKDKDKPFILDGYPRTIGQAEALNKIFEELDLNNYNVIYLKIAKDLGIKRTLNRLICPNCKVSYNKTELNGSNYCSICNSELTTRPDDNIETYNKRFNIFLEEINPIVEYYKGKNKFIEINANKGKLEIMEEIEQWLK